MAKKMKPDKSSLKMLDLPSDWWQNATTSTILIQHFKRHLLPLLVAGFVDNQIQYNIYTGIYLKHGETIVWLTAGHVVEELKKILSSKNFKLAVISWLDGFEATQAESIPMHKIDIPMKSWQEIGLDIGVVLPSLLDVGNLQKNERISPIEAVIWKNLSKAQPEGYYAIGFPRPWCQYTQTPTQNKKTLNKIIAETACLPLEQIPPPPEFFNDKKWSDPEAFYGRLIPFPDYPEFELEDANGMSGGPIISVERDPDGRIRYRLVGILQSFAHGQSIFRAEPISKVAGAIDTWLDKIKNSGTIKDAQEF
jgi:hypothetical protein